MGDNICKWNSRQRLNLQNIQTAYAAQLKKNTCTPIFIAAWFVIANKRSHLNIHQQDTQ